MPLKMTSQNPLKEVSQVFFDLNERECVKGKRLMLSNLNQSGMFDLLCFMQIYDKIYAFLDHWQDKNSL